MTAGVITFSNQMGANGGAIARAVAEKLHYRYYDWEVISQAAAEAGVSPETLAVAAAERSASFIERAMRRLLAASDPGEAAPPAAGRPPSMLGSEDYRQFIEHVVRELAQRGDAVIVGHAGVAILRNRPGVLRVLLVGSKEQRIQRMATAQGSTVERAEGTIQESDRQRTDLYRTAYHMDWLDASAYDVALNTDRLSLELARDMIVACAREVP